MKKIYRLSDADVFHLSMLSMNIRFLVTFSILTFSIFLKADISNNLLFHPIQYIKPSEYKGESQVWSVTKGKCNDVFFAVNDGLVRFDGVRWRKYGSSAVSVPILRSLYYDEDDGLLYCGGVNEIGYWKEDDFGDMIYTSLYKKPSNETTQEYWGLVKVPFCPYVYFQSYSGVIAWNKETHKLYKISGTHLSNKAVFAVNQNVYLQEGNVLYQLKGIRKVPFCSELFHFSVIHIAPYENGSLMLYSSERRKALIDHNGKILSESDFLPYFRITSIGSINQDQLLIGTGGNGLLCTTKTGELLSHIKRSEGLKCPVLSVGVDNKGDIWAGLNGGIMHEERCASEFLLTDPQEEIGYVYAVLSVDNHLYVGTNKGLYVVNSVNEQKHFEMVDNTNGQVWNLYQIENRIYVAHDKGLMVLTDRGAEFVKKGGIYSLIEMPNNEKYYLSGDYNGLSVYEMTGGKGLVFKHKVIGYNNLVQKCFFDKYDNLWIAYTKSKFNRLRFDAFFEKVQEMHCYEVPAQNLTKVIMTDIDKEILFYNNNGQAYRYNEIDDKLVLDNYYSSILNKIGEDIDNLQYFDNVFWYVHETGIGYLYKLYNCIVQNPRILTTMTDRFIPKGFRKVFRYEENLFTAGLLNSIAFIKVQSDARTEKNKPELSQVIASDEKKHFPLNKKGDRLVVEPGVKSLTLFLTGLVNDKQVEYQMDDNQSGEWLVSRDGQIEISYLEPGERTLSVRNVYGPKNYSEPLVIHLQIKAPWYRTRTLYFIYFILLIILLSFICYRIVLRERKKLDALRIKELEQQREQMALAQLSALQTELEKKNAQLMNIAMLDVQNNNFLKQIRDDILDLKSDSAVVNVQIKRLLKLINNQLADQSGWSIFEEHFNDICNGFFDILKEKHSNLTSSDIRLCAYLRMNLGTKEIASLMNISVSSVEMAKYRLRKKMCLDKEITLPKYLNEEIHRVC